MPADPHDPAATAAIPNSGSLATDLDAVPVPVTRPHADAPPHRRQREQAVHARINRYLSSLYSQLSPSRRWIDDPDYALCRDEDAFEKFLRDAVVRSKVDYRLALVSGNDWYFEARDPRSRPLIPYFEALLGRIARFQDARCNMGAAVFEGSRWFRQNCTVSSMRLGPDRELRRWWWVTDLADINKQRVKLVRTPAPDDAEATTDRRSRRASWVHRWALIPVDGHGRAPELLDEWDLLLFGRHVVGNEESTLGHGRGLYEAMYHYWRIKAQLIIYLADFCERVGGPWIIVKKDDFDAGNIDAVLGGSMPAESAHAATLANKVRSLRRFSAMVLGGDEHVSIEDGAKGEGSRVLMQAIEYCDKRITELCLGSSMPTGGDAAQRNRGGAFARARVEHAVTDHIVARDRLALEETVQRTLIANLHRFNRANWAALGLGDAPPPRFRIGNIRRRSPDELLPIARFLAATDRGVLASELYELLGLTMPKPGDAVVHLTTKLDAEPAPQPQSTG